MSQSVVFFLPLSTSLKAFSFDFQLTITGVSIFAEKRACHFSFSGLSHTGRILPIFHFFFLRLFLMFICSLLPVCSFIHLAEPIWDGGCPASLYASGWPEFAAVLWTLSLESWFLLLHAAFTSFLASFADYSHVCLLSPWQTSSALWLTCNCLQWLPGLYL